MPKYPAGMDNRRRTLPRPRASFSPLRYVQKTTPKLDFLRQTLASVAIAGREIVPAWTDGCRGDASIALGWRAYGPLPRGLGLEMIASRLSAGLECPDRNWPRQEATPTAWFRGRPRLAYCG